MTEKRFSVPDKYQFSHSKVQLYGEPLTNDMIVRLLNVNDGAFIENFKLKKEINELKEFKKQISEAIDNKIQEAEKYYYDESVIIELKDLQKEFMKNG